jgi:hypothetical protein
MTSTIRRQWPPDDEIIPLLCADERGSYIMIQGAGGCSIVVEW